MSESTPGLGIIGPVRFSYMSVFAPRANKNKTPEVMEFSTVMLIPKESNGFCPDPAAVCDAITTLVNEAIGHKFSKVPPVWDNPLKDGDKEINKNTGEPKHPGYWYINATAKEQYPPTLIDCNRVMVTGGWQSGDWGKAQVYAFGYDVSGNRGVSFGLRGIQFLKHDEPLSGSVAAKPEDFGIEKGDASRETTVHEDYDDPFSDE